MAYRLKYSDYPGTAEGPPDPERWVGPPGPMGPPGPQGVPGPIAEGGPFLPLSGGTMQGVLNVIATGGNTARSVQDRFAEVIDIHDYGQIGTGNAATDTATFLAAVAALPTNGGVIKIGGVPTSITLNQTIVINKTCKILGDTTNGWASSIVCLMSGPAFRFSDPTPSYQKTFEVESVRFVANGSAGPTQSAIQVNIGPTSGQVFPSFVGRNITISNNVANAASPYAQTFTHGIEFVPASAPTGSQHCFWNVTLDNIQFLGAIDSATGKPITGTAAITYSHLICAQLTFVHASVVDTGLLQTGYSEGIMCRAVQFFTCNNGWAQSAFSPIGNVKLLQPVLRDSMINAAVCAINLDCVNIGIFQGNYLQAATTSTMVLLSNAWQTEVCNNSFNQGSIGVSLTLAGNAEGGNVVALNVMQNVTTGVSLGTGTQGDSVLDNVGVNGAALSYVNNGTNNVMRNAAAIPLASSTVPIMNGVAAVGAGTTWARSDHVHPSDTSRAPLASPTFTGTVTLPAASLPTNASSSSDTTAGITFAAGMGISRFNSNLDLIAPSNGAAAVVIGSTTMSWYLSNGFTVACPIGFNSTAPIAKPTVTGAKGSNAALASLMTALAAYGLVTDSTSA
jgi:hypothetical protein